MPRKVICSVCGEENSKEDAFCGKCGSNLTPFKELIVIPDEDEIKAKPKAIEEEKEIKRKWYQPPKRERPAYHPMEWLFWIGWSFYVIFGFLGKAFWFILKEIGLYFKWCCCWGPPSEL